MNKLGKILFFNANDGQGIIMTSEKEKINFSVQSWDDFDTMPSLGLEVRFLCKDNIPTSIVSLDYVDESENVLVKEVNETSEKEIEKTEIKDKPSTEHTESPLEKENSDSIPENENIEVDKTEHEHFEEEAGINELSTPEEFEEEIGEREESVTVTLNLSKAVANYLDTINKNIEKRAAYKKVDGKLDYLVIRRFLWTTFNNLSEIDLHIISPKIKALSNDLKAMASVYDDFMRKTKYPKLAYEEVFLSCQAEYKKIREGAEKTIQRLNQLKGSEKHIGSAIKIKKEALAKELQSDEFDLLQGEFKSLNGAYVDIVHMMAELDERYKYDMKLLNDFEKEYKEDFNDLFEKSTKKYKKSIVDILSAQAFTLDSTLWSQARASKAVKAHFHKAGINGEFNTKTYLKYYLDTQDNRKLSVENKKLFELYDYLLSLQRDYIMIVMSDVNDALELESMIKKEDKVYEVKAFIDEKSALKWAMKHSVKLLILESQLTKMPINTFLHYYKKYILVIPKIILLGDGGSSDLYRINKRLSRGVSPKVVARNVKELFTDEKDLKST